MKNKIIEIKNLSKEYRSKQRIVQALDNVSLTIYEGEVLSLLGVNGAGKTTLSSIIATLHPPTSGKVLYNGRSIYKDLIAYRNALGFCPQRPNLDVHLSVEQNLIFAGKYFLLPKHEIKRRVEELLEQFNLTQYRYFNVNALSGGYKQRLLIARALIHKPKILLLDEPTVGLDPDIRRNLWEIIKELKRQGMTIILTTHYLDEAEILSDRVCILHKGRVIMIASIEELKQKHEQHTLEEIFLDLVKEEEKALVKP